MREAQTERVTRETGIKMKLTLAGAGNGGFAGSSGIGFFDHMLNSFAVHGGFRIDAAIEGDLYVDAHHSVLDDRGGIARFGSAFVPMDESLAFAAVDISGRPYLAFDARFSAAQIGSYDTQLTVEFFRALAYNMGATLHLRLEYGGNAHHETEALFKAAARAISAAVTERGGGVLSAKGTLD